MSKKTVTIWTGQKRIVHETIEKEGVYHVKREYVQMKYQEAAKIFLTAYDWFVNHAQKIVPRPEDAGYPVWCWADPKYVEHYKGAVVYKLEVPEDEVLIFDNAKWERILNLSYIHKDTQDREAFTKELERYGVKNDYEAYLSNFYPQIKHQIRKSWDRLFDDSIQLSSARRAALWEIKKEWIKEVFED